MKLAFIIEDESWFWVLDETGCFWRCWYENGDAPAVRLEKLDRLRINDVTEIMGDMTAAAMEEKPPAHG